MSKILAAFKKDDACCKKKYITRTDIWGKIQLKKKR